MFSRSRSSGRRRYNFGSPKKETNKKKRHPRPWIFLGKNKDKHDDGVMMSGDSPPPPLRASGPPSPGFDISDEGRVGKNSPTGATGKILRSTDTEAIEEAVPIIEKTLPAPEPRPKIERNGLSYDIPDGKELVENDAESYSCLIKCLSFTQQCCDCTIQ